MDANKSDRSSKIISATYLILQSYLPIYLQLHNFQNNQHASSKHFLIVQNLRTVTDERKFEIQSSFATNTICLPCASVVFFYAVQKIYFIIFSANSKYSAPDIYHFVSKSKLQYGQFVHKKRSNIKYRIYMDIMKG